MSSAVSKGTKKRKTGTAGGSNSKDAANTNTLLVVVLDVSPLAWGERDVKRGALDRSRKAAGKGSMGPTVLEEIMAAVQAFCNAVHNLERDAGVILMAVADNESAVVYPRKNVLAQWMKHHASYRPDIRQLKQDFTTGVAELMARTVRQQARNAANPDPVSRQAGMAAALSSALCCINRLLVAARAGGVSALQQQHYMERSDDQGVVAMMDNKGGADGGPKAKSRTSAWSPRIFLIQASEDRARDYNALMNCAFAAMKNQIVIDGCFLSAASSPKDRDFPSSSSFLEQVCDLTGGVFSAPSGMAQIGGALTEVLLSVFLAPLSCRPCLNLPALNKVDFRARCFETGTLVDMAYCCNLCLSIFRQKPVGRCPTCDVKILSTADNKRK